MGNSTMPVRCSRCNQLIEENVSAWINGLPFHKVCSLIPASSAEQANYVHADLPPSTLTTYNPDRDKLREVLNRLKRIYKDTSASWVEEASEVLSISNDLTAYLAQAQTEEGNERN